MTTNDADMEEAEFQKHLAIRMHGLLDHSVTKLQRMMMAGDPATQLSTVKSLLPLIRASLDEKSETEEMEKLRGEFEALLAEVHAELSPPVEKPVRKSPARKRVTKKPAA